jgi:hypothetical protein
MPEESRQPDLSDFEKALRGLTPAGAVGARDHIVFRAGQASARRQRFLAGAVGMFCGAVLALSASWALERAFPQTSTTVIQVPVAAGQDAYEEPKESFTTELARLTSEQAAYFQLQDDLAERGFDCLPRPTPIDPPKPLSVNQLLGNS